MCLFAGGTIQVALAKIKKQRQPERDADGTGGDDWHPKTTHAQARSFDDDENAKHHSRNQNVPPKEAADSVGKQIANKKRQIDSVLRDPRNKLPVRQQKTDDTQREVKTFHRINSSAL